MSKMSRRIVIDASVARSAGTTENSVSTRNREFLNEMLHVCHTLVLSRKLNEEWLRHSSSFTIRWLATMRSRRKLVYVTHDETSCQPVLDAAARSLTRNQQAAVAKDTLLVSAAWATDELVASNDATVRCLLDTLAADVPELRRIAWVSPTASDESPVDWLKAGARHEPHRRLGK